MSQRYLGRTIGAVIARQTGALHVFATSQSVGIDGDIHTAHLLDLDVKTADHKIAPAYKPVKASINNDNRTSNEGVRSGLLMLRLFAAGSALQGQLGIGERQFALEDEESRCCEWSHDTAQYSENWQEVQIPNSLSQQDVGRQLHQIAAGYERSLFVVGDRKLNISCTVNSTSQPVVQCAAFEVQNCQSTLGPRESSAFNSPFDMNPLGSYANTTYRAIALSF
ncbi:hypothetical protein BDV97DRAFT_372797 [Delphinella strobiligena]|nr:hypothetical protein BDV97DRAFT_372797 [Delphinella strobiligena]